MAKIVVEEDNRQKNVREYHFTEEVRRSSDMFFPQEKKDSKCFEFLFDNQINFLRQALSINGVVWIGFPTRYSIRIAIGKAFDWGSIQKQVIGCIKNTIYTLGEEEKLEVIDANKETQEKADQPFVEKEDPRQSPFVDKSKINFER